VTINVFGFGTREAHLVHQMVSARDWFYVGQWLDLAFYKSLGRFPRCVIFMV